MMLTGVCKPTLFICHKSSVKPTNEALDTKAVFTDPLHLEEGNIDGLLDCIINFLTA